MAMLIKGTAVDTLWPAGGKRGNEGKKQIDCVSTNAAGKEKKKPLEGPCNLKSKINDVPMLKKKKKKNGGWNSIKGNWKGNCLKLKAFSLPLDSLQEKWAKLTTERGWAAKKENKSLSWKIYCVNELSEVHYRRRAESVQFNGDATTNFYMPLPFGERAALCPGRRGGERGAVIIHNK